MPAICTYSDSVGLLGAKCLPRAAAQAEQRAPFAQVHPGKMTEPREYTTRGMHQLHQVHMMHEMYHVQRKHGESRYLYTILLRSRDTRITEVVSTTQVC
jgi:hypothetical protein